ncbi:MAG: hypothetical protein RMJ98_14470 [Myxococcales bacterium]|nr:hypothetical protein [Polyangiaceae bacterium]MDW8250497.1 hypothetical protein [Myxococcales bacterium]
MRFFSTLLMMLAIPALFPACNDDSGSSGTGSVSGSAATADQFIASVADIVCTKTAPCCQSRGFDGSGTQCRNLLTSRSKSTADLSKYDPAKGQACLDQLKAAAAATPDSCEFLFSESESPLSTPACESALPPKGGSKAPGEPCSQDEECATPEGAEAECHKETTFENGGTKTTSYCRILRPGKEGSAPCFRTIDGNTQYTFSSGSNAKDKPTEGFSCNMAEGFHCASSSDGAPPTCKRLLTSGATCSFPDKCEKNLFCKQGVCSPRGGQGAECDTFDSTSCTDDFFCESKSKTCQAKKNPGSPCEFSEECKAGNCNNGTCTKESGFEDFILTVICGGG